MRRIFLDMEYWFSGMSSTSGRPTSNDDRHIVQIAAIKTDDDNELDHMDILVAGAVPSFFTELTGITQHDIDAMGIPIDTAVQQLTDFCEDYTVWIFDKDLEVIQQNCAAHGIEFEIIHNKFIRVKPLLGKYGVSGDYCMQRESVSDNWRQYDWTCA